MYCGLSLVNPLIKHMLLFKSAWGTLWGLCSDVHAKNNSKAADCRNISQSATHSIPSFSLCTVNIRPVHGPVHIQPHGKLNSHCVIHPQSRLQAPLNDVSSCAFGTCFNPTQRTRHEQRWDLCGDLQIHAGCWHINGHANTIIFADLETRFPPSLLRHFNGWEGFWVVTLIFRVPFQGWASPFAAWNFSTWGREKGGANGPRWLHLSSPWLNRCSCRNTHQTYKTKITKEKLKRWIRMHI